jgi:hypothetical protein
MNTGGEATTQKSVSASGERSQQWSKSQQRQPLANFLIRTMSEGPQVK